MEGKNMAGNVLQAASSKFKQVAARASEVSFRSLALRSLQPVTLLSGIGGSFLKRIAPPEETSVGYALGIATLAAFVSYILILVLVRYLKQWKIWLLPGPGIQVQPGSCPSHVHVATTGSNPRKKSSGRCPDARGTES
jgi:hypothetical protein